MGQGFSILVWDSWGAGLVRVNPRLLDDGTKDIYGNPRNWFSYKTQEEKKHKIQALTDGLEYFEVID